MSHAAAYLTHLLGPRDIHNSCYSVLFSRQEMAVIKATVDDLHQAEPRISLVLTSSVAGMGFDPPSIVRVIHIKPPRSLSHYLQEIGRAGRRGQPSNAILYFNKKDGANNLHGIQDDICSTVVMKIHVFDKCYLTLLESAFVTITKRISAAQIALNRLCVHCNVITLEL